MSLAIPKYIDPAQIADATLRYKWDDWNLQKIFESKNAELYQQMLGVSYRANLAFTIGCGEWIIHRYDNLSDDQVPLQHMESAWAAMVDIKYAIYWEPPDKDWLGPIRGPLSLAIIFTLEARTDAQKCGNVAMSSEHASNLAEYIMSDPVPFLRWRDRLLKRLQHFYPLDEDEPMGDVVPREALDPKFSFRPEMSEELVQGFLNGVDPNTNPFLLSAEEMLKVGFKGTPYKFDIEKDRLYRFEW